MSTFKIGRNTSVEPEPYAMGLGEGPGESRRNPRDTLVTEAHKHRQRRSRFALAGRAGTSWSMGSTYSLEIFDTMSMTSHLLDQLLPVKGGWAPDERGAYVLSVLPDVVVNLIEDPATMELHFLSAVGEAGDEEVIVEGAAEAPDSRGRKRVLIAEETGLVTALRTVDMLGLDGAAFTEELGAHVAFARVLGEALAVANPVSEADHRPAPSGVVSTWRECRAAHVSTGDVA